MPSPARSSPAASPAPPPWRRGFPSWPTPRRAGSPPAWRMASARLEDYSGQFKLRLPKSLHRALSLRSSEEGVSMNQLCLYLLSKGLQA